MIHYITTNGIGVPTVANELRVVQNAEIPFVLHSMRRPEAVHFESEWAAELERNTRYLYPLSIPTTVLAVLLAPWLYGRRFFAALLNALFGRRESLRGRIASIAHLFVACQWARQLRREPVHLIHAQWIHSSGTIGMYGAWLLGAPFSFTGHAADLFRERVALEDKIRRADFIVGISKFHRDFYQSLGARDEQLLIVYCGIAFDHYSHVERENWLGRTVQIRSAGRLVEKKGFEYLIEACRILDGQGVDFHCTIAGSGPLEAALRRQIVEAGLADRVTLTGEAFNQEEIPEFMRGGDLFCLPCVWAADGDVDGLPQVLMEAMACGLPVISTRLVGIPDLVIDGETGLLVEPRNAKALADVLQALMEDPSRASSLADAGCALVQQKFDNANCLNPLFERYRAALGVHSGEGVRRQRGDVVVSP